MDSARLWTCGIPDRPQNEGRVAAVDTEEEKEGKRTSGYPALSMQGNRLAGGSACSTGDMAPAAGT